jgi:hypothetical protein
MKRSMSDRSVLRAQIQEASRRARQESLLEDGVDDLNIKELKCSTCGIKVAYKKEAVDLTVNTCNMTTCGIRQLSEFFANIERKKRGESKVPALLTNMRAEGKGVRVIPAEIEDMMERIKEASGNVKMMDDKPLCEQSCNLPAVQDVKVIDSIEIDVPDPIVIFYAKNGKREDRSP